MCPEPAVEQRKHPSRPLPVRVEFHHDASGRDFPARCVDASRGGLLVYVPAATPVKAGDSLRVALSDAPDEVGEGPLDATAIRVDRNQLLTAGHIAVGMEFKGR